MGMTNEEHSVFENIYLSKTDEDFCNKNTFFQHTLFLKQQAYFIHHTRHHNATLKALFSMTYFILCIWINIFGEIIVLCYNFG